MRAIHSRHFMVYLLGLAADLYFKAGHHAEAAKTVDEGLAVAEATGERFYSAELWRLRGELLARASDPKGADASFRAGIDLARRQGAVALERKAADGLRRWSR